MIYELYKLKTLLFSFIAFFRNRFSNYKFMEKKYGKIKIYFVLGSAKPRVSPRDV